ncbi:MAG: diadenylate cyclase CdaA [Armatimonadaceae bacterium]
MISQLIGYIQTIDVGLVVRAVFDIAVVSYFIYRLLLLAKGKRAWWILIGLCVFFLLLLVSDLLELMTLNWILRQVTPLGPVAILILFYPELREVLEKLGRVEFWGATALPVSNREDMTEAIEAVVRAAGILAPLKIGALIVMEREANLDDVIATGTRLDAEVTEQLLVTIFHHGTPLHDGAVIIRGGRIVAAECQLPLPETSNINPHGHLRHRAAIGISQQSDAVVVVVSEERGVITLTIAGKQIPGLKAEALRTKLLEAFGRLPKPKKDEKNQVPFLFGKRPTEGSAK